MSEEIDTSEEGFVSSLYEIAILAYEKELRRDEATKTQASSLQAAISFAVAGVSMVMTVIVEKGIQFSDTLLYIVFSSIYFFLLYSLFIATKSQEYVKHANFLMIYSKNKDIHNTIVNDYTKYADELNTKEKRQYFNVMYIAEIQEDLRIKTDSRIERIISAMALFKTSLFLCFFWFIILSLMLLFG